jgi:predicted dehydrogenase
VLGETPWPTRAAAAAPMAAAAARAATRGVRSMVGFTYRRVPAVAFARQLVAEGRLGQIRHVRAQYLQDWIADPAAPMSWRLEKDKAGSGALGDIGAHIVDLTQYITGQRLTGVSGMLETFVTERPLPAEAGLLSGTAGEGTGQVTVDDAALFLGRFSGGALATFEATRFALGRKNAIRIEINGSGGSLAFDFEDMNVLHFFDGDEPAETAGFRRIVVTEPGHPYVAAWWPPGHGLGYEHGFTHQVVDLVTAIAKDEDPTPSFADGLQVQRVLDAVERSSADDSTWTQISEGDR